MPINREQVSAMDDTMTAAFGDQQATEDALSARLAWFDRVLAQNCMPHTSRLAMEQRRNDTEQQLLLMVAEREAQEHAGKLGVAIYWTAIATLGLLLLLHFIADNWPSTVVL